MVPPNPIQSATHPLRTVVVACAWLRREEIGHTMQDFDVHLCIGIESDGNKRFHHFLHKLNPKKFHSPSNDVAGTMGLLGGSESEARMASFDRTIGDLLHIYTSDAFCTIPPGTPVRVLVGGPLIPKMRGRFLLTGASTTVRVFFVTREMKWLERMDLQGSSESSSPEEYAHQLQRGTATKVIPPAGQDKGTRCWLVKNSDGELIHFELIANMSRGAISEKWQNERKAEVVMLADDISLRLLTTAAQDEIRRFHETAKLPQVPAPSPQFVGRRAGRRDRALAEFSELPERAAKVFLEHKNFFTRKEWSEFVPYVEKDFWPKVISMGRVDGALAAIESFRPLHVVNQMQNLIKSANAIRRLRRLLDELDEQ